MGSSSSKDSGNGKSHFTTERNDIQVKEGKQVHIVKFYGPKDSAIEENLAPLNLANVSRTTQNT